MKLYLALIAVVVLGFVAGCAKAPDTTVVIPPASENTQQQPPTMEPTTPPSTANADANIQNANDTFLAMDGAVDALQ